MSTVTRAQICNLALAHINQTQTTISNLATDRGNTATICRTHYDVARRAVLADHAWTFATMREALADVGGPASPWLYRYDYPSDCLQARAIQQRIVSATPPPFAVELIAGGAKRSILTDVAQAVLIYTADVQNEALFTPGFVQALSWHLAAEIAPALSGNARIIENAQRTYARFLAAAQATDSAEGESPPELDANWIQARA